MNAREQRLRQIVQGFLSEVIGYKLRDAAVVRPLVELPDLPAPKAGGIQHRLRHHGSPSIDVLSELTPRRGD